MGAYSKTCSKLLFLIAEVKCNPVNKINNGYVYNQNECGKNEFGATCIFRCNPNFKLVGNDVLKCGASGTYIGDLPECRRKYFDFRLKT